MKIRSASFLVSLLGFAVACGDLATPVDPMNSGGQGSQAGSNGKSGNGSGGAGSRAGSGAGGASSHAGSAGKGGKGGKGGVDEPSTLELTSVEAHVVGRNGDAVRFTVKGTQADSKVNSIAVTFADTDGAPVAVFNNDFDGEPESADGRVVLDAPVVDDTFTAVATLPVQKLGPLLATAKVQLVDTGDRLSNAKDATIGAQTQAKLGEACDATLLENRCDAGQSCSGMPATCTAGVAPDLLELKYFHGTAAGPLILARGTDPDDDMGSFHIELLDNSNMPVSVGTDTMYNNIDTEAANWSSLGSFFAYVQPSEALETDGVTKVRVTPMDSLGHSGSPLTATVSNQTRVSDGMACDTRGFIGCAVDSVCVVGMTPVSGKCTKAVTARTSACKAAPLLDPENGITAASGRISGSSLWDPPMGCNGADKTGRPEAVVRLHLTKVATKLVISTAQPETLQDTVLYLVKGCTDQVSLDMCNDDTIGFSSTLELTDLAAGDYTIIIESGELSGGAYGVAVQLN